VDVGAAVVPVVETSGVGAGPWEGEVTIPGGRYMLGASRTQPCEYTAPHSLRRF